MSTSNTRPGKESLADYRGAEPAKTDDEAPPSPPVADDESALPPVRETDDVRVAGTEPEKPAVEPVKPKLSPFEEKRARIAARFTEHRAKEGEENPEFPKQPDLLKRLAGEEPEPPPPDEGAAKPEPDTKAPAKPGPSALEEVKPETMTLVVNGKTVTKTLAEVAALSELSEDEVRAKPESAKRFAQRELASAENLERARNLRDTAARPASPAPNQEREDAGNDGSDQPPAARDTSETDMAKLIEDIQIGDPKEVAPKLAEIIAREAGKVAKGTIAESHSDQLRHTELQSNISAVKEFLDEHPEFEGKPAVAAAISGKLDEEFRADLRTALLAEGETEGEVDDLLAKASRGQIRNAHLARRLNRNPHVRKIDKALIGTVFDKVRADFGFTGEAPKPQQLDRSARKDALPSQPRRASVPPATHQQPPTAPLSRRQVVAEMAERTGKKRPSLPR